MTRVQVAAITMAIFEKLKNETTSCRREWSYSIYYAISRVEAEYDIEPQWTKYKDWNINHHYRASKTTLKKHYPNLLIESLYALGIEGGIKISGEFRHAELTTFDVSLMLADLRDLEISNENGRTLLDNHESGSIIQSILEVLPNRDNV